MRHQAETLVAAMLAASLCLLAGPVQAAGEDPAVLERGRALVVAKCARCHAVAEDASPHEKAPPFREIVGRYPVENLAEALAEGIVSGHPDMPVFVLEPDEIEALLLFLETLRPAGTAP